MFIRNRTMISSVAAITLSAACLALAQEPPPFGSGPATYVPAQPSSAEKQPVVVDPNAAPDAEPQWDGDKPFITDQHAPQFPAPTLPQEMLDGFRPAAATAFNLSDARVQYAPVVEHHGDTLVQATIDGVTRIVRLQPHNMRAEGAKLVIDRGAGVMVEQAWPPPATYRGIVEGAPQFDVAASIRDGEVSMLIHSADEAQPSWFVQPLRDALPGMPAGLHIVYNTNDVIPRDAHCGWNDANPGQPVIPAPNAPPPDRLPLAQRLQDQLPPRMPAPLPPKTEGDGDGDEGGIAGDDGSIAVANVRCQIGLDADVEFYQANGSSVLNTIYDMEMIMNQVGMIYQNQVAIAYTETILIVRTAEPDPYGATNANTVLCEFQNFWNASVAGPRDVAQLFTGKDLDGSTVGFAWIGAICVNISNCNGGQGGYGIVQSRFATDLASRTQDTAHELGHNWNGCHCNTGGNCGGGSSNPTCGIMTSGISGQLNFDAAAVTAITAFRDSRPCLDVWQNPTYVNWSWGGAENGSLSNPWNTIFEGLDACLVGGALNVQAGNYFQNPNIFKAKTINALNGLVRIGN